MRRPWRSNLDYAGIERSGGDGPGCGCWCKKGTSPWAEDIHDRATSRRTPCDRPRLAAATIHAGGIEAGTKIAVIAIRDLNRAVSPAQTQPLSTGTVKLRLR
jgi:hypothetical protein